MGVWELFRRYPCLCCFIIAGAFLLGAVLNADSLERMKTYRETEAEVCNLEAVKVMRHRRFVTRYNYDVIWHLDGVKYIRHMRDEIDGISEGKRTIWVSMDNQKYILHPPREIEIEMMKELLIGIVAGIAGVIALIIRKKDRRKGKRNYGKS